MREVRWEFAPGRVTLDVKGIPLRRAKIRWNWSLDRLLPFGTPILRSIEAAHFLFHMKTDAPRLHSLVLAVVTSSASHSQ
ncbi:hypothetical protein TNCV_4189301 [Trichonephila clavipes]|nr:hypothetical protein TNCV_4189301 [Trichonephila clavipes]